MKNKKTQISLSILLILFILILGTGMRLYKINEYLTFLGDEGRDVLVVKRIIVDHKLTLLGPITSVGSMYMGPVYYYFMIPFLWFWHLDPTGPAIMVAMFSILTIALIYKTGSEFFHPIVGLVASYLYSLAPLTIIYGKSSWNPNLVPFFSLLIIYSMLKTVIKNEEKWFIIALISLGINIQLHYVAVMFIPIIFSILLLIKFRLLLKTYLIAFISFVLAYSPFLLFEIRHKFVNLRAVYNFLILQKGGDGSKLLEFINTMKDVFIRVFWRLLIVQSAEITKIFLIILFFLFIYLFFHNRKFIYNKAFQILLAWFLVALVCFGFYKGVIYDYYFGSLFVLPFIIFGIFTFFLWNSIRFGKIISIFLLIVLTVIYLNNSPFKIQPNNMLKNTKEISNFIFKKTNNKQYNFALITDQNSDHAYRYFLEVWGNPPVQIENPAIDPERNSVTSQLFIICEKKICQPLGHPLWEIAGFGRAEIDEEWNVSTIKIFRLIHYNG